MIVTSDESGAGCSSCRAICCHGYVCTYVTSLELNVVDEQRWLETEPRQRLTQLVIKLHRQTDTQSRVYTDIDTDKSHSLSSWN